ncbi:Uncharacterised protein [Vibrio cholerae]|nr:Uncharacterised protein [Vibrio cholerae]
MTLSSSSPSAIALPSRNTEKLFCMQRCRSLRITTGSSPPLLFSQRIVRAREASISDAVAGRASA